MFMIGACSVLLLVLEAIVGDLTHWTAITAATGATAGLAFAELGLRSSR